MHIPDGFFEPGMAAAGAVVAAGGVAVCVARSRDSLGERQVPLAGLTAAFIFAVQMVNFPVAAGTSGHLFGGVLAAVLVGPWTGALCIAVVLMVQALFADGGLTALGLNIIDIGLITALGGYVVFAGLRSILGRKEQAIVAASAIAAFVSVLLAAAVFSLQYAIGGAGGASAGTVAASMMGVHTLIGIGEAIITALTVGAVIASRPDLVYGMGGAERRAPEVAGTGAVA